MKIKITQTQVQNITKLGLFICVIALIVQLFPSKSKFKYQFEVGKPWSYELITASFDFPIYKSDLQITKEKEEILKDFTPYFKLDSTKCNLQINKLFTDWKKKTGQFPISQNYIKRKFQSIYAVGIISVADYNKLLEDKRKNISCITPSRVSNTLAVENVYTPKTAYEEILRDAPEAIKSYDLNVYLVENLKYDSATTELSKTDLLKNLSLTSGMVQTGQRIIDRGEIITPANYLELSSLKIEYEKRKGAIQQSSIVVVG